MVDAALCCRRGDLKLGQVLLECRLHLWGETVRGKKNGRMSKTVELIVLKCSSMLLSGAQSAGVTGDGVSVRTVLTYAKETRGVRLNPVCRLSVARHKRDRAPKHLDAGANKQVPAATYNTHGQHG
jgi:hypothetical protein